MKGGVVAGVCVDKPETLFMLIPFQGPANQNEFCCELETKPILTSFAKAFKEPFFYPTSSCLFFFPTGLLDLVLLISYKVRPCFPTSVDILFVWKACCVVNITVHICYLCCCALLIVHVHSLMYITYIFTFILCISVQLFLLSFHVIV